MPLFSENLKKAIFVVLTQPCNHIATKSLKSRLFLFTQTFVQCGGGLKFFFSHLEVQLKVVIPYALSRSRTTFWWTLPKTANKMIIFLGEAEIFKIDFHFLSFILWASFLIIGPIFLNESHYFREIVLNLCIQAVIRSKSIKASAAAIFEKIFDFSFDFQLLFSFISLYYSALRLQIELLHKLSYEYFLTRFPVSIFFKGFTIGRRNV